jgi:hypothetical protein
VSNLASLASTFFLRDCLVLKPDYVKRNPSFDCRAWNVPTKEEWVSLGANPSSYLFLKEKCFEDVEKRVKLFLDDLIKLMKKIRFHS